MGDSNVDCKILSYNDVVLRRADLGILRGPCFLNDRVIEFYFSYLSDNHGSDEILLVPPSITFWISNCPDLDSLKDVIVPLRLPDRKLVIFPVNNNSDVSLAEGGTHWSLLAYARDNHLFIHHDSNGSMNKIHAVHLYNTLLKFMGDQNAKYIECTETPQQANGYDCGVYVMTFAGVICEWHRTSDKQRDELWYSALGKITSSSVSQMRKDVFELITQLMSKMDVSAE